MTIRHCNQRTDPVRVARFPSWCPVNCSSDHSDGIAAVHFAQIAMTNVLNGIHPTAKSILEAPMAPGRCRNTPVKFEPFRGQTVWGLMHPGRGKLPPRGAKGRSMRSVISRALTSAPDVSLTGGWFANHRVAPMSAESAPMAWEKTRTYIVSVRFRQVPSPIFASGVERRRPARQSAGSGTLATVPRSA